MKNMRFMAAKDACELLGVSLGTLQRLADRGDIAWLPIKGAKGGKSDKPMRVYDGRGYMEKLLQSQTPAGFIGEKEREKAARDENLRNEEGNERPFGFMAATKGADMLGISAATLRKMGKMGLIATMPMPSGNTVKYGIGDYIMRNAVPADNRS